MTAKANETTPFQSVRLLGIWRLVEPLHVGKWSTLYAAQPADSAGSPRADYVVKVATEDAAGNGRRMMRNEAAAALSASDPHLTPLLDADVEGPQPYIVLPRLEATTLQEILDRKVSQRIPVVLWWVRQCASAVAALHRAGWRHGDIKPENILVGDRGHVTLIDLGFASRLSGPEAVAAEAGTPSYAAPEIDGQHIVGPAADIYSLGCVMQQLLAARNDVPAAVAIFAKSLTAITPTDRPAAEDIVRACLRLEIETLGDYISPFDVGRRDAA